MRFLFEIGRVLLFFFFISSLGCLWLRIFSTSESWWDIRLRSKRTGLPLLFPCHSWLFKLERSNADRISCRSASYEQPWRNAVGQLPMDCSSFAAEHKEKGQQQKRRSSFARVSLSSVPFCCLLLTAFTTFCQGWPSLLFLWVSTFSFKDVQGFFSRSLVFAFCCVHSTCTCLQLTSPLRHTSMTMAAIPHFSNIEHTHEVVSFDVGQFDACTEPPMAFQFAFTSCLALSRLISARHSGRICACARDISRWKRLSGCREVGLAGANNSQDATNLPVGREKINWVFAICLAVCWPLPLQPIACHFRMRDVRRGQTFGAIAAVVFLCLFSLDQKKKLFLKKFMFLAGRGRTRTDLIIRSSASSGAS